MTTLGTGMVAATAPVARRVRAYFAPVNRTAGVAAVFDAAASGGFNLDAPPAPWLDLGWCAGFERKCGTKVGALSTGAPGIASTQVRTEVDATVAVEFESWGKLQLALSAGSQQMNLLKVATGATANGSGGSAISAVPVAAGSTATALQLGAAATRFAVGDLVAVDVDYTGQVGFVGSGVSGAYVASAAAIGSDVDYVRRVTLNVGRVVAVASGVVTLGAGLVAGVPAAGMRVNGVVGFCDREGGTFFQEWSAVFVLKGEQGDRVIFYYPRLQAMQGAAEKMDALVGKTGGQPGAMERARLAGAFRALAVKDANDGQMVLCFRSYLPAAMRAV